VARDKLVYFIERGYDVLTVEFFYQILYKHDITQTQSLRKLFGRVWEAISYMTISRLRFCAHLTSPLIFTTFNM